MSGYLKTEEREKILRNGAPPSPHPMLEIGNKRSMEFCIFSELVCVANSELAVRLL